MDSIISQTYIIKNHATVVRLNLLEFYLAESQKQVSETEVGLKWDWYNIQYSIIK